ncbi:MAG: histidine kinase [bacterium]|nr:histidine kinase [bacterium]
MKKKIPALFSSIRGKVLAGTVAITAAIAIITVFICFFVFQSFLRQNQLQSAEHNLQIISNNVSANMENILAFSQWCCTNTDISHYLESIKEHSRMPSISSDDAYLRILALNTYNRLKEEYNNTYSSSYISRVVISPCNQKNYLQISDTSSSTTSIAADILHHSDFFEELLQSPTRIWIGLCSDPLFPVGRYMILPILRPVYSQYSTEAVGWSYVAISDRLFLDYLDSFYLEQDSCLYLHIGSHIYQLSDGALVETDFDFQTLSDISDRTFDPNTIARQVKLPDGSRRTIITCPLGTEGWQISQLLSEEAYQAQSQLYVAIIVGITAIIIFLGFLLYIFLNRIINQPIQALLKKIDSIALGDFSRDPSIEWPDEFGAIGRCVNHMSENVVTLMDKKVEDEKQKKDLEYQILQSQINPHFLYNTLNSIKWMATIQNASGIAEMTTSLARLMKNVSKGTAALIPLKEELDLVKDYFLIQQYRYGGTISMDYQIESDELLQCLIHRFTLQPIIENAMFHGIEPKGCAGHILVKVSQETLSDEPRLLCISVTDNGIGMSQETIEKVLKGDTAPTADFFRHVGISNVAKRIQYEFGEQYGITIESQLGEYTTMHITLPCRFS